MWFQDGFAGSSLFAFGGGDHLSCSTLGLFGQFQAAVTNSGGSLVVFVFFFSAGGSF